MMKSLLPKWMLSAAAPALAATMAFGGAAQAQDQQAIISTDFDLNKITQYTAVAPANTNAPVNAAAPTAPTKPIYKMNYEELVTHHAGDLNKAMEVYEFYQKRIIHLNENVTDISANRIVRQIEVLDALDPEAPITLSINSDGGSVHAGFRIYNAMMKASSPVNTYCDTTVASMAAILFAAGDTRTAGAGCQFMTHGTSMRVHGNSGVIAAASANADTYNRESIRVLSSHSGLSHEAIEELRKYELNYSGQELIDLGFADALEDSKDRNLEPGTRELPEHLRPVNKIRESLESQFSAPEM